MSIHYNQLLAVPGNSGVAPLTVTSPYSNEILATVERANEEQLEQALEVAHRLFRDKKQWLSPDQRVAILEKVADLMSARVDELAQGAAAEGGKPLMDSTVEVQRAIDGVKLCIETIRTEVGAVIPMSEKEPHTSRMAFTQKEPIGLVVAVSAFNHPLNLIVHQVGAAIAAGCPTVVKPAAATPLSCLRFVSILHEAGLPLPWCQVILPATTQLSTQMVSDPRVAFFSFIGSARVGWMLRSKLAPGTRCALEHGGVAPVIVDRSANVDKLVPSMLKGGYYHAGQVCVSVQRLFVHTSLFDEVTQRIAEGVTTLKVGDPLSMKTQVGPLINSSEVDRVHNWVQEAVSEGAVLAAGGNILPHNCYQPTLLVNPAANSKVSRQEIFGPVICLYAFDELDTAIEQANSLPDAFQAAVFSQDIDSAIAIYHQLDASAVMVNDSTAFRQDQMPFAGLRSSGMGVGGIPFTIDEMQIEKMMVIKSKRL